MLQNLLQMPVHQTILRLFEVHDGMVGCQWPLAVGWLAVGWMIHANMCLLMLGVSKGVVCLLVTQRTLAKAGAQICRAWFVYKPAGFPAHGFNLHAHGMLTAKGCIACLSCLWMQELAQVPWDDHWHSSIPYLYAISLISLAPYHFPAAAAA